MMLKGIPVILVEKHQDRADDFGAPIYTETDIIVDNVLVMPASSDDVITSQNLYGKKAVYTLAIPKGDEHKWTDTKVKFFGEEWRTFGFPLKGIDELIPLDWNMKVWVERYD